MKTKKELFDYISRWSPRCVCCRSFKQNVMEKGLDAIDSYDGFICPSIERIKDWYYLVTKYGEG